MGALLAYLSLHSGNGDGYRAVLEDILRFIEARKQSSALDDRGRAVLDVLEARIRQELDND